MKILAVSVSVFVIGQGGRLLPKGLESGCANEPFWAWGWNSATSLRHEGFFRRLSASATVPGSTLVWREPKSPPPAPDWTLGQRLKAAAVRFCRCAAATCADDQRLHVLPSAERRQARRDAATTAPGRIFQAADPRVQEQVSGSARTRARPTRTRWSVSLGDDRR